MTTWTWKFRDPKVANIVLKNTADPPEDVSFSDVIRSIGYELTGTRGEGEGAISRLIAGETGLPDPNADKPEDFIPFNDLNEERLLAILSGGVDIAALKRQIDAWLDETSKPLPF